MITIRAAQPNDLAVILDILAEASDWLHEQDLDQWPNAFPADRIFPFITAGDAYVAEDDDAIVACFALSLDADPEFWTPSESQEPALYLSKLARRRSASNLGSTILQWCLDYCARLGLKYLRFDAWKTNEKLQKYYMTQGFTLLRTVDLPHRRSGALFQKAAARMPNPRTEITEMLNRVAEIGTLVVGARRTPEDAVDRAMQHEQGIVYRDSGLAIQAYFDWSDRPLPASFVIGYVYRMTYRDQAWHLDHAKRSNLAPDDPEVFDDHSWKLGERLLTTPISNQRDAFGADADGPRVWLTTGDDERREWTLRRDRTYVLTTESRYHSDQDPILITEVAA